MLKKITFLPVIILFSLSCASAQDLAPKFDEYLGELVKQERFTGAVLISRDGKAIFSKGYGMANAEFDIPNTPQTKFRLGSITKQFTAVSFLLLQERGKLDVQDPICKYVDNCPDAWKEITIHHLLSHTAGLPNFTSFPDYSKTMMIPATLDSLIARFKDKPLEFKPGEKFNYSNSGYILLGYILEKVAGESYESFLQKNIFDPLKMVNSGYDWNNRILKNRATGYSENCQGWTNSAHIDMSIPHAAGALFSTVEDLFLWNEALFSDRIISAKSRELMTTPVKNNYGYGIGPAKQHNRTAISHGGGINGFATFLTRFPEEKVNVVVLRNASFGSPAPGRIAQDLAAILFGEKVTVAPVKKSVKIDPGVLDAYVGKYEVTPAFAVEVKKSGACLMVQATGQPEFDVFAESENKFFLKVVDAGMTFVKDEKGNVTHMILHQGGDKQAKKIK